MKPLRSGRWPMGLVGTIAIIIVVESFVARHWVSFTGTATLSWTLSERASHRQAREANVLCFGDSLMKHGLLPEVLAARLGRSVHNLSVCAAQAPTSYYLLKHAIESGAKPDSIVVDFMPDLLTGSPRHAARYWPELLSFAEILELSRASRDFPFLITTSLDRIFVTNRCRWEIRANILSALRNEVDPLRATNLTHGRNWAIHRGAQFTNDNPTFDGTATTNDHFRLMSDRFWCNRINRDYVHHFLTLAESRGIRVYWVLPPVAPTMQARREQSGVHEKYGQFVREVASKHPGVVVLDARRSGYPHQRFVDPIHLTGKGALALTNQVADAMSSTAANWVDLPPVSDRPLPFPLEDVEQSRQVVLSGLSTIRR